MILINLKGAIDSEENRIMMELWDGPSEICSVETCRRVLDEHPDEQMCIRDRHLTWFSWLASTRLAPRRKR